MNRLSLILPFFIFSILFTFCNGEAPTEGQLLNTYNIDSVVVVYPDTTLLSTSSNVQVFEYPRRFLVFGSFQYLNVIEDSLTFYDVDLHQWVLNTQTVGTAHSKIFIQVPFSYIDSLLRLYGHLLKGKYN
ncbi:hypothetical protein ES705_25650 [subsurface metagenome]